MLAQGSSRQGLKRSDMIYIKVFIVSVTVIEFFIDALAQTNFKLYISTSLAFRAPRALWPKAES